MASSQDISSKPASAKDILAKASMLVSVDRKSQYGDCLINHQAVVSLVNGYLRARVISGKPSDLSAEDMATIMELIKIGRRLNGPFHEDNYTDGAGYAALAGEIASRS